MSTGPRGRPRHAHRHGVDQRLPHDRPKRPFGGYKQSGIGRELGTFGYDAYRQVKHVHVNPTAGRDGTSTTRCSATTSDRRMKVTATDRAARVVERMRATRSGRLTITIGTGCCESTAPFLYEDFWPGPDQEVVGRGRRRRDLRPRVPAQAATPATRARSSTSTRSPGRVVVDRDRARLPFRVALTPPLPVLGAEGASARTGRGSGRSDGHLRAQFAQGDAPRRSSTASSSRAEQPAMSTGGSSSSAMPLGDRREHLAGLAAGRRRARAACRRRRRAATAGSSGTWPSSGTPISSARACPPPSPNSA